ncbi:uncharacterized protein LODBEIA_P25650 [Lodderomyces beijingensis]|uniref:Partial AB-hydrolase lipase domain-containing protein n=1 Tax=Lodderomyces beijingensis TaxID=1775926 RepID=A0ABP0ZN60_9ASCO
MDSAIFTIERDKKPEYGFVLKYWLILLSSICSVVYTTVLCTGAVIHHWWYKLRGKTRYKPPDPEARNHQYRPRIAYKNIDNMKATPDLRYYLKQLDLDLEEHSVTTPDGFILVLHRIIDPRETQEQRDARSPILMQHGLLSCSGTWIVTGRNSLAYYFHEAGYDVWMGNNRSWFRAQSAVLKSNLYNEEMYWKWGVKELAYYDLPTFINSTIKMKPKHDKLILVGHSQGGLQSFLMLRNPMMDDVHAKVKMFVSLSAAVYPGYLFHTRNFLKILTWMSRTMWKVVFGFCAILRNLCLMRYYMASTWIFAKLSYYMFKFLFGWTNRNWGPNDKIWHFCFIFNMSYVSVELFQFYVAKFNEFGFVGMLQPKRSFLKSENYSAMGLTKDDSLQMFPYRQTWFDANIKSIVPMLVVTGEDDFLVDGHRLTRHMRECEPRYKEGLNIQHISIPTYNHLDVCWAEDVIGTIAYPMQDMLKRLSQTHHAVAASKETVEAKAPHAPPLKQERKLANGDAASHKPRHIKKFVSKSPEPLKATTALEVNNVPKDIDIADISLNNGPENAPIMVKVS